MQFFNKWRRYLQEAQQDAKVLRGLNVKALQKEMPQFPEEGPRDYFARLQNLERDPEFLNPIFPTGLVDWVESLPDNHYGLSVMDSQNRDHINFDLISSITQAKIKQYTSQTE